MTTPPSCRRQRAAGLLRTAAAAALCGAAGCVSPVPTDQVTQVARPVPRFAVTEGIPLYALQQHGDLGGGSLASGRGDVVLQAGFCYQLRPDGTVYTLPGTERAQTAAVVRFRPDLIESLPSGATAAELAARLAAAAADPSIVVAFRVVGRFDLVRTEAPAAGGDFRRVSGTLIGFRLPGGEEGAGPSRTDLWFVSHDLLNGGRVSDFTLVDGSLAIDVCDRHLIINPAAARAVRLLR